MESVSNTQEKTFDLSYQAPKEKSIGHDEVSLRFARKDLEDADFTLGNTYSLFQNYSGEYFIVRDKDGRKEKDAGPYNTSWSFSIKRDPDFEGTHPIGKYYFEIVDHLGDKAIKIGPPAKPCDKRELVSEEPPKQALVCNKVFLFDEEAFYIAVSKTNGTKETPWLVPQTNISCMKTNRKSITIFTTDGKTFYANNPPAFFNARLEELK